MRLPSQHRARRHLRTRRAAARLLALALVLAPHLVQAACPSSQAAPRLTVAAKDTPVHYRYDLGSVALTRLARDNGTASRAGEIPLGLTIGRYDLAVTVQADMHNEAGGGACAELQAARIEIGLKQLDVLVDRRFPAGSCQRDTVLDHEAGHVAVFREALQHYQPALVDTLASLSLPPAVMAAARNDARNAYLDAITAAVKPIFAAINARASVANAALDTPHSYADVLRRCDHW